MTRGYANIRIGSKVEFQISKDYRPRDSEIVGEKAINVTAVGGGPCDGGFQFTGKVTKWDKGRLIIEGEEGKEYHATRRQVESYRRLREGDEVEFEKPIRDKDDASAPAPNVNEAHYIVKIGGSWD